MSYEKSEKYIDARESLPKEMHGVFNQFVKEYLFHTTKKYGKGYVAYAVLAELVRDGWRPPTDTVK